MSVAVSRVAGKETETLDVPPMQFVSEKPARVDALLSLTVFLGIAVVAWSDHAVETISLGYLYLLPLALSALVHPLSISLVLAALCIALHDWLGPFSDVAWPHYFWSLTAGIGFFAEVLIVNRLGRQRDELTETIRKQRDELARDMRLASDVQRGLLPRRTPYLRGFDLAATIWPARLVSGDFFDYFTLPDRSLLLVIGDVSGKGVAAGLLTSAVTAALRTETLHEMRLDQTIARLNRLLYDVTSASRFVTLFCANLHPSANRLEYVRAGHLPALVYRGSNGKSIWLEEGGPLLGVLQESQYVSGSLALQAGDVMVLYTDGVVDAENADGEPFNPERLAAVVREEAARTAPELLERIQASVVAFSGNHALSDDATLLVLKAIGTGFGRFPKEAL